KPDATGKPAFTVSAVDANLQYQIFGGGTWTDPFVITMVRRPLIQSLSSAIHLPEYMGLPEPRPMPHHAAQIAAPVGSTIEVSADVSGNPQRGQIRTFKAATRSAEQSHEQELVWFDDDTPADAQTIGKWQWTTAQVYSGTRAYTFNWKHEP